MHPPLEVVFRECTADDIINKLRDIGCEVERIAERGTFDPRIDPTSKLVTQPLSVNLNGIEPFGGSLTGPFPAWRDNVDECCFVYMPQNPPVALLEAFNQARAAILESLKSDPAFVRHSFISIDDYKTSRDTMT